MSEQNLNQIIEKLWNLWHSSTTSELEAFVQEAYKHPEWPKGYSAEDALFGRYEDGKIVLPALHGSIPVEHTIRISGYLSSLPLEAEKRRRTSWPTGLEHCLTLIEGELRLMEGGNAYYGSYEAVKPSKLSYQHYRVGGHLVPGLSWDKEFAEGDILHVEHY